jgi:hypothetical protein
LLIAPTVIVRGWAVREAEGEVIGEVVGEAAEAVRAVGAVGAVAGVVGGVKSTKKKTCSGGSGWGTGD